MGDRCGHPANYLRLQPNNAIVSEYLTITTNTKHRITTCLLASKDNTVVVVLLIRVCYRNIDTCIKKRGVNFVTSRFGEIKGAKNRALRHLNANFTSF